MIYTFTRTFPAPTTAATLPPGYTIETSTLERACAQFARTFGLKVLESFMDGCLLPTIGLMGFRLW